MQVELHTELEQKIPFWIMRRIDKMSITVYPNRLCGAHNGMVAKVLLDYYTVKHPRMGEGSYNCRDSKI